MAIIDVVKREMRNGEFCSKPLSSLGAVNNIESVK